MLIMKKAKTFTPHQLVNSDPLVTYTYLSGNYFRVADELRNFVQHPPGQCPGRYYVFPAVIMFTSCIEAFFQEHLAILRYQIEEGRAQDKEEQLANIDCLRDGRSPYQDFKDWIKEIFRLCDRSAAGIDTNSSAYQDIIALKDLRNAVAHYNPMFIEHIKWPARLEQILQRAKPEVLNAGWVTNLSSVEVADWAFETIKTVIVLFCEKSGAQCPFTSEYEGGLFRW